MAIHSKASRAKPVGDIHTWVLLCAGIALVAGVIYWLYSTGTLTDQPPAPIRVLLGAVFAPGMFAVILTARNVHADFGVGAIVLMAVTSGLFWGTCLFLTRLVFRSLKRRVLPHLRS